VPPSSPHSPDASDQGATTLACVALAAVLLAAIGATQDLIAWFPLRFLLGSAIAPLFVLSEVWIIALAPPERRGRVMGAYTTLLSAGFAAGPLVLALVGSQGWPPFLLGIAAFLACGIYLAAILPSLPSPEHATEKTSVRGFLPHAPFLLLAVAVTAAFALGILSLLPIYGLSYGIGEARMSAMLGVFVAGNMALQVPLGLAAERFGARDVMVACALATALGCLLLPLLIGTFLVWPLVFVWGAVSFGIYTMSLVDLGARFSGAMLVAGNAAVALMWGVGGMAGPPTTGLAMDVIGAEGLPITLGLLCLLVAAAALMRPIPSRQ
jgi:MFS family permease